MLLSSPSGIGKPLCVLAALWLLTAFSAGAQPSLSYEQAFKNAPSGLLKPLPHVVEWTSSSRFRINNADNTKTAIVDIRGRKISDYMTTPPRPATVNSSRLPANAKNLTLSPDQRLAAYTFNNDLYVIDLGTDVISQLTTDGCDSIMNGYASWVYYEEVIGRWANYKAFWWSPDSKWISFMRFDESPVPVFPIYVATGQYGYTEKQRYPKAGGKNPKVKMGIVNVAAKKLVWADFDENDDQYFRTPYFSPAGDWWIQWVNRRQNNLKIYRVDKDNGSKKEVLDEKQDAWVSQNDGVYFLPGNKQFINRSDKSGWSHLYLYDMSGRLLNPITAGKFSTGYIVKFDSARHTLFFTARKENSARIDLYRIKTDGTGMQRITKGDYSYTDIVISPRHEYFIATYSNTHTPSVMAVFDMQGQMLMKIDSVQGPSFQQYNLPRKELIRVKSTDGLYELPVTITYPIHFDPQKKYPVLMSVYGGPYTTNVMDAWALQPNEVWWAQEGLIQVSADNRGSWHFGKEGLDDIYGKAGIPEIEDFMAVGRWLKQQSWMDTSRLCMTGFSHGGYMTCLALTYGSSVFNYGLAHWPLIDWHLYDTYYTERYMGLPSENPEGYKTTSVLYYANRYRGGLRVVHGASDNNTHLQNVLQLMDTLQNLNKSFEVMIYPGQRHGLTGDKWKHNKMETYRFFYKNLLNRPIPEAFLH